MLFLVTLSLRFFIPFKKKKLHSDTTKSTKKATSSSSTPKKTLTSHNSDTNLTTSNSTPAKKSKVEISAYSNPNTPSKPKTAINYTPLEQQYLSVKKAHPDTLLLVRFLGVFCGMFDVFFFWKGWMWLQVQVFWRGCGNSFQNFKHILQSFSQLFDCFNSGSKAQLSYVKVRNQSKIKIKNWFDVFNLFLHFFFLSNSFFYLWQAC